MISIDKINKQIDNDQNNMSSINNTYLTIDINNKAQAQRIFKEVDNLISTDKQFKISNKTP